MLAACLALVGELLVQVSILYLLFLEVALRLLRLVIQLLDLPSELGDLLLGFRPLRGELLLVSVLELLDDLVLLGAEVVELGQVGGFDVVDHALVLVLQQLEVLVYLQHCLAALSPPLLQDHFLPQVNFSYL